MLSNAVMVKHDIKKTIPGVVENENTKMRNKYISFPNLEGRYLIVLGIILN